MKKRQVTLFFLGLVSGVFLNLGVELFAQKMGWTFWCIPTWYQTSNYPCFVPGIVFSALVFAQFFKILISYFKTQTFENQSIGSLNACILGFSVYLIFCHVLENNLTISHRLEFFFQENSGFDLIFKIVEPYLPLIILQLFWFKEIREFALPTLLICLLVLVKLFGFGSYFWIFTIPNDFNHL